ncbi:MAG: group III truncated hemoglobin [Gammaproteobacteria bacterium]|nr:group III truncated hemoglobin [Gammaproteobacteria bacterium]
MKIDTITEETITQLVYDFYTKVRKDAQLGPFFIEAIGDSDAEWKPHLLRLVNFWSSIMLTSGKYRGNPMKKHKDLPPFDRSLFDRWLELFAETAHELHNQEVAEHYIEKSQRIAESLKCGLYQL